MTALDSLVRVHSWVLDEKRHRLAGLEALANKMRADLTQLEADLETEQRAASDSIEGTVAFPAFVAAALERRKKLRESIANLERAVAAARDEVHEAFQEMKKYELARDHQQRREQAQRARRERTALDELGVSMYLRKKMSGQE